MKRLFSMALACVMLLMLAAGCNAAPNTPSSNEPTRVAALKGPTAMGMVKLMSDSENKTAKGAYTFQLSTIDELTPLLSKGEVDIACIPANLASVLYNNTQGQIQSLAINTLGVLYIVENGETVSSVEDLRGKTIYATGKGATPEYTLRHILKSNGIDPDSDVTLDFRSEPAEVVTLLAASSEPGVAMLPEPFVSASCIKNPSLRVALDLTAEWDAVSGDASSVITGLVVVRADYLKEAPFAVSTFMEEYKASTEYAASNVSETAELIEKYDIVNQQVALQALPNCNIVCIDGTNMKDTLNGYLTVLYEQNPKSVGGKVPDEAFYVVYLPSPR